jgi:ParB-like nuclease family protein
MAAAKQIYGYLKSHPPTKDMIRRALDSAFHVDVGTWELVLVPVKDLDPAQDEIEGPRVRRYTELMKADPAGFPPILISPLVGLLKGSYRIVDGHHRYWAAREAGVDWLWALLGDWRFL